MNPTVLVTGASRGIGRAIAIRFAQEGYNVAMGCHSHPEQAYQISEKLNKAGMQTAVLVEDLATVQGACALVRQTQELFGRLMCWSIMRGFPSLVCLPISRKEIGKRSVRSILMRRFGAPGRQRG